MNRAQRRKIISMVNKGKVKPAKTSIMASRAEDINDENSQAVLDSLPTPQLVAGVNNLLQQLRDRGVTVKYWDAPERTLERLQYVHGNVYYLAPYPDPEEPEQ